MMHTCNQRIAEPTTYVLKVNIGCCGNCPQKLRQTLEKRLGVAVVQLDVENGLVTVGPTTVNPQLIIQQIHKNVSKNAIILSSMPVLAAPPPPQQPQPPPECLPPPQQPTQPQPPALPPAPVHHDQYTFHGDHNSRVMVCQPQPTYSSYYPPQYGYQPQYGHPAQYGHPPQYGYPSQHGYPPQYGHPQDYVRDENEGSCTIS